MNDCCIPDIFMSIGICIRPKRDYAENEKLVH